MSTEIESTQEPLVQKFQAYESGQMGEDETVLFFQTLISTGMAWSLQGHYGRMAYKLIAEGKCEALRQYKKPS